MPKRTKFLFDHVEIDLITSALEFWSSEINSSHGSKAQAKAAKFTQARINELLNKIKNATPGDSHA